MNIVLFTDTFEPQVNGVVSYVVDTATYLVSHGHKVLVVGPKSGRLAGKRLTKYPFKVLLVSSVPAGVYPDLRIPLPNFPKALAAVRKFHADIIHLNDPFTLGLDGIAVAKILRKPVVVTFHSFYFDKEMVKNVRFRRLAKVVTALKTPLSRLNSLFHNFADVVICPSQEARRELVRYGLKKPSIVIPNGIAMYAIQKNYNPAVLRRRFAIPQNADTAVFVGRIAIDKSIDVLIKAWKYVLKTNPHAYLILIGSGPMEPSLKKLAVRQGIADHVRFLGNIDRGQLIRDGYYYLGDIYVSASTIENQSMSMIEAMAHGLPIVGVASRGTGEIVNAKTGILVPSNNPKEFAKAVGSLFRQPELMRNIGRSGALFAKRFDIELTGRRLVSLYKSMPRQSTSILD